MNYIHFKDTARRESSSWKRLLDESADHPELCDVIEDMLYTIAQPDAGDIPDVAEGVREDLTLIFNDADLDAPTRVPDSYRAYCAWVERQPLTPVELSAQDSMITIVLRKSTAIAACNILNSPPVEKTISPDDVHLERFRQAVVRALITTPDSPDLWVTLDGSDIEPVRRVFTRLLPIARSRSSAMAAVVDQVLSAIELCRQSGGGPMH